MDISSPTYASLQELIVSDQIFRDKALKLISLIIKLENTPSYGFTNIFLINRPRGFGLSLFSQAIDKIMKKDHEVLSKIEDEGILHELPQRHSLFIDFKQFRATTVKDFAQNLILILQEQFWLHHIESQTTPYLTPKVYFSSLVEALCRRHDEPIVIFIDNYDIPLMQASIMKKENDRIEATSLYLDMLNILTKCSNLQVKWCFLTGHTKFNLASEFSEGIPLIEDLSSNIDFENMFGFTRQEVKLIFKDKLEKYSKKLEMDSEEYLDKLELCYGGFSFSDNLVKVMCPACISHVMNNNGLLLPYSASGSYSFLRYALNKNQDKLEWLFNKDGQDPIYANSIDASLKGKQIGTLLVQLGFATRARVLLNTNEGYTTWRYRFECPNLDMQKTFELLFTNYDQKTLKEEITKPLEIFNNSPA